MFVVPPFFFSGLGGLSLGFVFVYYFFFIVLFMVVVFGWDAYSGLLFWVG